MAEDLVELTAECWVCKGKTFSRSRSDGLLRCKVCGRVAGDPRYEQRFVKFSDDPSMSETTKSPLSAQVGGDHYRSMKIQPVEFITENGIPFLEGCVIKRVCRWRTKGSPLEDLKKAKHEIDLLIEFYEREKPK